MAQARKWGPHFLARARRLWDKGLPAAAIAEACGLGREGKNIIIGIAHRNAFPARPSPLRTFTAEQRREMKAAARLLCFTGSTVVEIAAALKINSKLAGKLVCDINPRRKPRAARASSHIGAAP